MNPTSQELAAQSSSQETTHETFVALVTAHDRMLFKVCWVFASRLSDREDLFQEIVSQLWSSFKGYDPNRKFSTWMYRVALNVAIDYQRKRKRTDVDSLELSLEPVASEDSGKQEQLLELRELMEQFHESDRSLLLLTLEGHSYREIADILGMSESNVGTRLGRLKKSLRTTIQNKGD
jgi:RNA polymerase sigma-70 factor, ECF subfamily